MECDHQKSHAIDNWFKRYKLFGNVSAINSLWIEDKK